MKNNNSNVKNKINVRHMIKSTVCYLTNPYQLIFKDEIIDDENVESVFVYNKHIFIKI